MALRPMFPNFVVRTSWEIKYLFGRKFNEPADTIEKVLDMGVSFITGLGCGRGGLLAGLRRCGWSGWYLGVDISRFALSDARRIGAKTARSAIESFRPPVRDLVVSYVSIYYIPVGKVRAVIARCVSASPRVLLPLHDFSKHSEHVEELQHWSSWAQMFAPFITSTCPREIPAWSSNSSRVELGCVNEAAHVL
jgi:hypothetical protein